jgi:phthalate 4,5-dioxygenase reductase subunit
LKPKLSKINIMKIPDTMPMLVKRRLEVSQDTFSFELVSADASAQLPPFTAGAHVAVLTPSGELREYSLCNAPSERYRYVIAVKRDAQGQGGSVSMADQVREGDTLQVSQPENYFLLEKQASQFLFVAGGIGITPILSMIRHLQQDKRDFKLIYCTRSPEMTAFRDELSSPELVGKVVIHHDHGDRNRSLDFTQVLAERPEGAHLYCCGPSPLMHAVRDNSRHWPQSTVHFEDFGSTAKAEPEGEKGFLVRLARTGIAVLVAPGVSILDALREQGVEVPSSCESGTCGSCRATLLAGEPEHRDFILGDDEKGEIMICISRAKSDELVLDI